MTYRIDYTDAATMEIDQAYLWMDRVANGGAIGWFEGLRSTVESLSEMPYRYAEMSIFGKGVRRLLYGKFLVLYIVVEPDVDETEGTVRIMHVVHGARKITNP